MRHETNSHRERPIANNSRIFTIPALSKGAPMMAGSFSMIFFLFTLIGGGGGNHLLDYASTKAYWQTKGVAVSVQTMSAELKTSDAEDITQLVAQLASPDGNVRAGA